jgi:hypothetical protein
MSAKFIILGILATLIVAFRYPGVFIVLAVVVIGLLREFHLDHFVAVEE